MLRLTSIQKITTLFALAILVAAPLFAAPVAGGVADVMLGVTQVDWAPYNSSAPMRLTVSGPEGVVEMSFDAGETPHFDLASIAGAVDGQYLWKLKATPQLSTESRQMMAEARAQGIIAIPDDLPPASELVQSGSFRVVGGAIVSPDGTPEPRVSLSGDSGARAVADSAQFITDETTISGDLTVYNSLCVGQDCAASESYGADTIRLKENNLRIHFDDTSNSGSFPNTDWRLEANSSQNGGGNYFKIINASTGQDKVYIDAAAKSNAIYATSGGVGFHEDVPVLDLHATNGNTPGLRLEQDGSSGFASHTWDIAANETNFFVRDVNNSSRLPFRIKPGSGNDDALVILGNGDVGMGTDNPSEELHVVGSDNPRILLQDNTDNSNDKPGVVLRSPAAASSGDWAFEVDNAGNFQIDFGPSSGPELVIADNPTGNGTVTINGDLMVGGNCTGCDDVFQPHFGLESISEHADLMFTNSYLPAVGPTPEGRGVINVFAKTTGMLQELEKAHIYIAQLHERLEALEAQAAAQADEQE